VQIPRNKTTLFQNLVYNPVQRKMQKIRASEK